MASATSGLATSTCQNDPGGNSDDATIPVVAVAVAGFSTAAGGDPCAGWVVGRVVGWVAVSGDGCCPADASGAAGVAGGGTGTGDDGSGRGSAVVFTAVFAGAPSDASLAGRCVFCPTT